MESTAAAPARTPEIVDNAHHQDSTNEHPPRTATPDPLSGQRTIRIPLQACFTVTEITHTTRGATVLTLNASYESSIPRKSQLLPGAKPVGEITLEVPDQWALENVHHGTTFFLTS